MPAVTDAASNGVHRPAVRPGPRDPARPRSVSDEGRTGGTVKDATRPLRRADRRRHLTDAGLRVARPQLALPRGRARHRRPRGRRAGLLRGEDPRRAPGFGAPGRGGDRRRSSAGCALLGPALAGRARRARAATCGSTSSACSSAGRRRPAGHAPAGRVLMTLPARGRSGWPASQGAMVEVEVDLATGLPGVVLVGLPDAVVRQSVDRVRAAVVNAGDDLPAAADHASALSPAAMPKQGSGFDLALAVGGARRGRRGAAPRGRRAGAARRARPRRLGAGDPRRAAGGPRGGPGRAPPGRGAGGERRRGGAGRRASRCSPAGTLGRPGRAPAPARGRRWPGTCAAALPAPPPAPDLARRRRAGGGPARGRGRRGRRPPPVPHRAARARARRCWPSGCPGCCRRSTSRRRWRSPPSTRSPAPLPPEAPLVTPAHRSRRRTTRPRWRPWSAAGRGQIRPGRAVPGPPRGAVPGRGARVPAGGAGHAAAAAGARLGDHPPGRPGRRRFPCRAPARAGGQPLPVRQRGRRHRLHVQPAGAAALPVAAVRAAAGPDRPAGRPAAGHPGGLAGRAGAPEPTAAVAAPGARRRGRSRPSGWRAPGWR